MANYNVQITRGLRFAVNRKTNEAVIKQGVKFAVKRRRDDWIENFGSSGSSGGGGGTGSTKRRVRFRFP
jgi:hypothetical protein